MSSRHIHYLLSALHGEGVLALLFGNACPGLFYVTPAQDGILSRMRIAGGILNSIQCRAIADIAQQYGGGYINVTNRANLQVREIRTKINSTVLKRLQDLGLGSPNPSVDHIRNIMTSPTAGIDPQELIDTRPFVQSWDNYIATHPALSRLPAKFSVGFDGGGLVSVRDRLNDIAFAAVLVDGQVYFRLYLSVGAKGKPASDMGILLSPEQCLPVLAALTDVYLQHIHLTNSHKPRLRELVNSLGCESYIKQVEANLPFSLYRSATTEDKTPLVEKGEEVSTDSKYPHIGIHPQRQLGLFYLGVVLPLGRLESQQLQGLADLAAKYSSSIRLTPWQNLLLTDIPQQWIIDVEQELASIGLDASTSNIKSALVACSGSRGCAAAATDTKAHALALAQYLETRVILDCPVNIHFSGCEKSCAQYSRSDIALLGVTGDCYQVYVGDGDSKQKFGRELYQDVSFTKLPALLEQMLKVYKQQRINSHESFGNFANRHTISQLKQLFSTNTYIQIKTQISDSLSKSVI